MTSIAFFNNKGGVGKTSLVYHLSYMLRELGRNLVIADLDPQANLTTMFLSEDRLESLWPDGPHPDTILGCLAPIQRGIGDITLAPLERVDDDIDLIVGDLGLSSFEDKLSSEWPSCLDSKEAAFRAVSALYRIIEEARQRTRSPIALIDVGPNLGAINRSALLAADFLVIPLAPDLFSLQGLRNLGPTLRTWREGWKERLRKNPASDLPLPQGRMEPLGYVVMQHSLRLDRPVKAYKKWMDRIPEEYTNSVLGNDTLPALDFTVDPNKITHIKHYRSLMPMAMEAQKPMFLLKPADGAIGAHQQAVRDCYMDFKYLAEEILRRVERRIEPAGCGGTP